MAARSLSAGQVLEHHGARITLTGRVGMGHKFALAKITKGQAGRKYR